MVDFLDIKLHESSVDDYITGTEIFGCHLFSHQHSAGINIGAIMIVIKSHILKAISSITDVNM